MDKHEELKVPLTPEELRRLEQTAEFSGLDVEAWAKKVLLMILSARESREANGER
jgi:hypothetical protein